MIKNFIFLGIPGTGKGTLAKEISLQKGIIHISTGDILRKCIKNKTKFGLQIQSILSSGKYVSDEIVNKVVKEQLLQDNVKKNGFILDGYPRTIKQAKFLEKIVYKNHLKIILLECDSKIILERLTNRWNQENRKDDSVDIIPDRIKEYTEKTSPLISYYNNTNQIITIDASGEKSEVLNRFYKEFFIDNN